MSDFIDVEDCGGSYRQVLYRKNLLEILQRHVLMVGMKK